MDSNEEQDQNQLRVNQNIEPTAVESATDSTLYWKEQSNKKQKKLKPFFSN